MTMPDDWTTHRLGELFEFSNGINADKSAYGQGTPFVNVLEVITSESLTLDAIPGRIALPKSNLVRYRVNHGDVLFNRTSETQDEVGLSSTYLGDEPVVFGGFVFRAQPKTPHLDVGYSKYCLRGDDVRSQITGRGQGGIRANIGQRDLKSVVVALPDVPEQRAIAEVLDDVSALVDRLQALIAKKRDIKQGMMQELLTGRTRLLGFADAWRRRTFGDLLTYRQPTKYLVTDTEYIGSGTPVLTAGKTFILGYTPEDHGIFSDLPVVIFDDFTTDSKYVEFPFKAKSSAMKMLIPKDGTNLRWAYESMQITDFVAVDHKRRWISEYSKIEIDVPTFEEQKAIAAVSVDADAEIDALERRLESARAIKVGMMQELLTGRTRLPLTEEA